MQQDTIVRPVIEDPDVLVKPDEQAQSAAAEIIRLLDETGSHNLQLRGPYGDVELPPSLVAVIQRICGYLANGSALTIVPYHAELTTQAAANLLGISRTRLIQLIDRGDLKVRREGAHRRLPIADVLAYRDDRARSESLGRSRIRDISAESHAGTQELEAARSKAGQSSLFR